MVQESVGWDLKDLDMFHKAFGQLQDLYAVLARRRRCDDHQADTGLASCSALQTFESGGESQLSQIVENLSPQSLSLGLVSISSAGRFSVLPPSIVFATAC